MANKNPQKILFLDFIQKRNAAELMTFCDNGKALMKANFENRKISFVCSIDAESKEQFRVEMGPLVIALIAIKSRFLLSRQLTIEDIMITDSQDNVSQMIAKYFTATIIESTEDSLVDIQELKNIIAYSLEEYADLTFEINEAAGNSINIFDMIRLSKKNKKVASLLNFTVNESQDYSDTVASVKQNTRELMHELMNDETSCYRNLISAISVGQFQQVFSNVGYKPEIIGSAIFPHCVNTNLYKGMRNEMDYYVSAMGSRKALITNALQVRRAGYTSRKLSLLVLNQKLDMEVEDCGTTNFVNTHIASADALHRLHGRYFEVQKRGKSVLLLINKTHLDLVGLTVKLRSPITCILPRGHICKSCYGQLHRVNPFHIGIAGVLNLTEQLTQRLLSSKHLLQINPEKIELPEGLDEYFSVDKTSLIAKKSFKVNIQDIETDESEEQYTNQIIIMEGEKHTKFNFESGKGLFLDLLGVKFIERLDDNIIDAYEDNEIFRINIENSELITPLKDIISLLESETKLNEHNYHQLLIEFLKLLEKSGIRSSSVTIELIIRELLRDASNIQERPRDFNDLSGTKFLRLTSALVHHPSAAITLAFERISYVVENNLFNKNQSSIIDALY